MFSHMSVRSQEKGVLWRGMVLCPGPGWDEGERVGNGKGLRYPCPKTANLPALDTPPYPSRKRTFLFSKQNV